MAGGRARGDARRNPRRLRHGVADRVSYPLGMLETGTPAPDFSVLDDEGNTRTLGDFAGKTLVLWFYPKADTPG